LFHSDPTLSAAASSPSHAVITRADVAGRAAATPAGVREEAAGADAYASAGLERAGATPTPTNRTRSTAAFAHARVHLSVQRAGGRVSRAATAKPPVPPAGRDVFDEREAAQPGGQRQAMKGRYHEFVCFVFVFRER